MKVDEVPVGSIAIFGGERFEVTGYRITDENDNYYKDPHDCLDLINVNTGRTDRWTKPIGLDTLVEIESCPKAKAEDISLAIDKLKGLCQTSHD